MRNKGALAGGLAVLLLAGGCWDYRELDTLAIAAGAALDQGEQGEKIFTAQLADLQEPDKAEARLTEGRGASFLAAGQQAAAKTGRKLYFGHAQTVVVSQQIARQDIRPVLDYISRQNDSLLSLRLMISRQSTAAEILEAQPASESLSGFELSVQASEKGQNGLDMPFYRFYSEIREEGIDPFLPAVSTPEGQEGGAQLEGAALFRRNQLRGFLDPEQTETLMLLRGMKPQNPLTLERTAQQGGDAALTLNDCRLDSQVGLDEAGRPWARLTLTMEAGLGELEGDQNIMSEQGRRQLEGQCAALLKGRAEELVRLLQQYECDALGLGLTLSRFEPKSWKSLKEDWRKTFAQTPIEIEVQVKITGAGRMYLPVSMEEGEQNG